MKKKIAIVDDEQDIRDLVQMYLSKSGFQTACFEDGTSFISYLQKETPDAIILDIMLPDTDGFEICKKMRQNSKFRDIPIIMLTAKSDEMDRVIGLEIGADDYVVKPFSPRELTARVKAIFRRNTTPEAEQSNQISIGNTIVLNLQKYEVCVSGKRIDLTSTEFRILRLLSEHIGWVYSRNQILDYLWGNEKIVLDRTIDVHIKNLRDKLGESSKYIKNIRGIGYKIEI